MAELDQGALMRIPRVFVLVMKYLTREPGSGDNVFSEIDFGFWTVLGFSVLLMFAKGKERIPQYD